MQKSRKAEPKNCSAFSEIDRFPDKDAVHAQILCSISIGITFVLRDRSPLDRVNDGSLDRFGFIDAENEGRVALRTVGGYFGGQFCD